MELCDLVPGCQPYITLQFPDKQQWSELSTFNQPVLAETRRVIAGHILVKTVSLYINIHTTFCLSILVYIITGSCLHTSKLCILQLDMFFFFTVSSASKVSSSI